MRGAKVKCIQQTNAILGEGPVWDARRDDLYWIDILRPAIYRHKLHEGQTGLWPMPSAVGAIGLAPDGRLVVALEHQAICLFDPATHQLQTIADPINIHGPQNTPGRFNDGGVDPLGNFWVGWLSHDRKQPGGLFRIEPSGATSKILDDPVAPNGIGWSPDGRTMYVTDSHINTIWAYDCDLKAGVLGSRRVMARQDRKEGVFDGLCVDCNGNVWTALYGGGAVLQYTPSGEKRTRIDFPARLITSCKFGGQEHRTLFVTSAVRHQSCAELSHQPLAGSLFSVRLPFAGLKANVFAFTGDANGP